MNYKKLTIMVLAMFLFIAPFATAQNIREAQQPVLISAELEDDAVMCTMDYRPVCGIDGETYSNRCVAEEQNRVRVAYEGECGRENALSVSRACTREYMPVCGADEVTYGNRCMAGDMRILYEGECRDSPERDTPQIERPTQHEYDWMERLTEEEVALLRRAMSMMNPEQLRTLETRGIEYAMMFIERVRNMMNTPTQIARPNERPEQVTERVIRQEIARDNVLTRAREVANENAAQGLERALANADERAIRAIERIDEERLNALARAREQEIREIVRLSERELRSLGIREIENENFRAELVNRIQQESEIEERGFRVRELPPQAAEQARERYQEAMQRAEQARDNFVETRDRFSENIDLVASCVQDPDEERCVDAVEVSKEHIERTLNYVISTVESMIERLESSEYINDEELTRNREALQGLISQLESLAERLENSETFSEVREIGREANQISNNARDRMNLASESIANNRVNAIIVQSNALIRRLEMMIEDLDEETREEIDSLIDRFYEAVRNARANQAEADNILKNAIPGPELREVMREVNELSKTSRDHLQRSREILRQIFEKIN